ncbi:MOSC domain-containing protein [Microbacterium sp. LRZ72]|uniref:MOSC domain-containing protein n=1 Tax=Microbacterium sp. LRZ72 TaxID=2942481 RepID=UPI0029A04C45|nr:MOSC domain-containing protein [Microbacterium sp. LRZ72]MDX2376695.1 MOSC domain-containing protein [Microbacterium sp. LRZ72]
MHGTVTDLYFYPIRGLSAQRLDAVSVGPDRGFPLDRCWALPTRNGEYRTVRDRPLGSGNVHGPTMDPRLAGVATSFDPESEWLEVRVQDHLVLACSLASEGGVAEAEEFFARVLDLEPEDRPHLVRRADAGYNFAYTASVSTSLTWACHVVNLASVRDLEERIGRPVDPLRFRANLYVDLGEPWIENDLLGRTFRVGDVQLRGEMATARCAATEVSLETAERDIPIPRLLMTHYGHTDFGIYANILTEGELRPGMDVAATAAEDAL